MGAMKNSISSPWKMVSCFAMMFVLLWEFLSMYVTQVSGACSLICQKWAWRWFYSTTEIGSHPFLWLVQPTSPLDFFHRKYCRSQWQTRWKISPRHYGHGKAVPRQVDCKYVGRLLLDTEEGCTWRQIPAKVICLNILEECFCLFHEHVKY